MMRERVRSCGQALRLGQQADANGLLIPILEFVAEHLNNLPTATATQVRECLARALHYQETQDHIALADELEYVLLPLIDTVSASDT